MRVPIKEDPRTLNKDRPISNQGSSLEKPM